MSYIKQDLWTKKFGNGVMNLIIPLGKAINVDELQTAS